MCYDSGSGLWVVPIEHNIMLIFGRKKQTCWKYMTNHIALVSLVRPVCRGPLNMMNVCSSTLGVGQICAFAVLIAQVECVICKTHGHFVWGVYFQLSNHGYIGRVCAPIMGMLDLFFLFFWSTSWRSLCLWTLEVVSRTTVHKVCVRACLCVHIML